MEAHCGTLISVREPDRSVISVNEMPPVLICDVRGGKIGWNHVIASALSPRIRARFFYLFMEVAMNEACTHTSLRPGGH
jgi:hypothetical protein